MYATGWFWWWLAFIAIFFVLPLGYGWGYRGWGPWYRRRRLERRRSETGAALYTGPERRLGRAYGYANEGWGWGSMLLWIALIIAIVWLIAAVSWSAPPAA